MTDYLLSPEEIKELIKIHPNLFDMGKAIAKEQHKKTIKWLNEPCTEHYFDEYQSGKPLPTHPVATWNQEKGFLWLHRYLCPECRKIMEE
jgi:hypothetical protein